MTRPIFRPHARPHTRPRTTTPVRLLTALTATLATAVTGAVAGSVAATAPAYADNRPTPRNFTGFGFDQCVAPTQSAMNTWLRQSPFLAVGIYISGDSRGCRTQPNLDRAWVSTQLRKGWRLLPITLGPQASCSPHFPRYGDDKTINPRPGPRNRYPRARKQGVAEAEKTARDAAAYGISKRSTLWYDLEAFDLSNTHCRESALRFTSAWTRRIKELGFTSGFYSSASSGIKMLDDARVQRPGRFHLPERIWIARWDGVPNTSTSYIGEDGWRPGGRMKQYRGGHDETWGGVRINIDSNFIDLGRGSFARAESHCQGTPISFRRYPVLVPGGDNRPNRVTALQCLLREKGFYSGSLDGVYDGDVIAAARAWQGTKRSLTPSNRFTTRHWVALLAEGPRKITKFGTAGPPVRRLQRAINASGAARVPVSGVYEWRTQEAVTAYQRAVGRGATGVANPQTWKSLRRGAS
jgi:hypothetical protein